MPAIMRTQLFEPATGSPDNPFSNDTIILIGSPLGSRIEQGPHDSEPGSAAARAQAVANLIGTPVCAYVRPTLHQTPRISTYTSLQPKRLAVTAVRAGDELGDLLGQHGYNTAILSSNSGDGPFAAHLARRGTIGNAHITHFSVTDPAGIRKRPQISAFRSWQVHARLGEIAIPDDYPFDPHDPPPNLARNIILDLAGNARVWASDLTARKLQGIAAHMLDLAVQVDFPEHTFNGTPNEMRSLTAEVNTYAPSFRRAPFAAYFHPGWRHGSFDNPQVIVHNIRRITGTASPERM